MIAIKTDMKELPMNCGHCDEVHVSVTFTWDLPKAERLADLWKYVAPIKIGGEMKKNCETCGELKVAQTPAPPTAP